MPTASSSAPSSTRPGSRWPRWYPAGAVSRFADPGLGASPTWHGFAIDRAGIAFTEAISVVGDQRMRIDLHAMRPIERRAGLGAGIVLRPGRQPSAGMCARHAGPHRGPARTGGSAARWSATRSSSCSSIRTGSRLPGQLWAQYGLAGVLEHEGFVRDVMAAMAAAGVDIEQFHPEYGVNQFEISLAPASPVAAADQLVLARIIDRPGRPPARHAGQPVAGALRRQRGFRCAPALLADLAGQPGVLRRARPARDDAPRGRPRSAGSSPDWPRPNWCSAGRSCPGCGCSPATGRAPTPAGAPRTGRPRCGSCRATHGNPHGANVEVKIVDPSANPYLATAAILGLALDGIERDAPLPPEITVDPHA